MSVAVDTRFYRGIHVEEHLLEFHSLTLHHRRKRIFLLAFDVQLHRRQLAAQGWLVDDLLFNLCHQRVAQLSKLLT